MLAIEKFGFTAEELKYLIINGFKSTFLPLNEKVALLKRITNELADKDCLSEKITCNFFIK